MPIVHVVLTRDTSSHTLPSISRQMCTTHFCWGNLTIGWHPDDEAAAAKTSKMKRALFNTP